MASEGQFPKVDGDVLYASEVNRFRTKVIGWQGTCETIASGAGEQYAGSFLYTGVYPYLICSHLDTSFGATKSASNQSGGPDVNIRYSGTLFNFKTTTRSSSDSANTGTSSVSTRNIFTSGAITASGGNVGSPFVIFASVSNSSQYNNQDNYDFVCLGV